MKSSTCRLLAGTVLALAAASAQALKAPEVDLRDPTIWEEKTLPTRSPLTSRPARFLAARTARSGKMKNQIFSENGSVGNSGGGITVMKICGENSVYSEITRASPGYV